ncbi:MAG: assimilatory sulfite reductase (NADPH) flavoprotein subunit [Bacteroidota bacterium]|nr:assimilatory sulfite reductase (NADPH) flavoprotein subunit [Bacteroidota bacterium]
MKQPETISILPLNNDQKEIVENLHHKFNDQQLTWLAGYLTGLSLPQSLKTAPAESSVPVAKAPVNTVTELPDLTILYGSRTGNGASVAQKLKRAAEARGFKIHFYDTNDYSVSKLKDEKHLLVIISTHGEGVPPIAAEEFYNFVHGKRSPKLNETKFSVLALGDSSYLHFCKTGKDIDQRFEELGAERIFPRIDCDVDFEAKADEWINGVLDKLSENKPASKAKEEVKLSEKSVAPVYNKQNPFKAKLLEKIQLNGRGSEKETWHYELSLEGSGLTYEPGDAVGVYGLNSQRAVYELIQTLALNPDEQVEFDGKYQSLEHVLTHHLEISSITTDVVKKYNELAQSENLSVILSDTETLKAFLYGRDIVDLVSEYPVELSATQLIQLLRKLQPRLYSISSSPNAHPDEIHLTVAAVRYANTRYKEGVCSTFLADRIGDDEFVSIYIEKNPEFRLPSNSETPVIMVGPGTGIAPFRSFLEEREASGTSGKNWLFFGDRRFETDFLYQTEFQNHLKKGVLTRLNVAFSRDTDQKVYVQHKMKQHAAELFRWLEDGAHFYVCGDMQYMWRDVHQTLVDIVAGEGGLSPDKAQEYIQNLKKSKRYQVDVY